jgi:hypothetical protein
MKTALILVLLCSTADAGRRHCHTRCQASLQKQLNRKWENENGITYMKWKTRVQRSGALFNFSKKLSPWGWILP